MCTQADHDELRRDWERFESATEAGFIQRCGRFIFDMRLCRRCHSALTHPRDLHRYGLMTADAGV